MVSLRALLAGSALIAVPVMATVGSTEVRKVFNDLNSEVVNLRPVAESISTENAALLSQGKGPLPVLFNGFSQIISDFSVITTIVETDGSAANSRSQRRSRATIAADGPSGMQTSKAYTQFLRHTGDLLRTLRDKAPMIQGAPVAVPPMVDAISELKKEYEGIAGSINKIVDDGLFSGIAGLFDGFREDDSSDESSDDEDSSESDSDEDDSSDDEDEGSEDDVQGPKQMFSNTRDIVDTVLIVYTGLLRNIGQGTDVI